MLLWTLLAITAILKFNVQWLIVVLIALALNGANCYGYVRCAKGTRERASCLLLAPQLLADARVASLVVVV